MLVYVVVITVIKWGGHVFEHRSFDIYHVVGHSLRRNSGRVRVDSPGNRGSNQF